MLNRKLRIKVTDGRVFYGYLNCFDKKGNIILLNATECRPDGGYVSSTANTRRTSTITVLCFFPLKQLSLLSHHQSDFFFSLHATNESF